MRRRSRVACVHQGVELYGSDRSFAAAVTAINSLLDAETLVILPKPGPIEALFSEDQALSYEDLLVIRKADIVKTVTIHLIRSLRSTVHACMTVRKADVTYINTCVIAGYLLAGLITRRPMIVHVREIPTGFAMRVIRRLLILSGASIIYNSHATRLAFAMPKHVPAAIVWNGFADPGEPSRLPFDGSRPLRLLCVGRINGWKGQDDLVAAISKLREDQRSRVELRILGGVYEDQIQFLESLQKQIQSLRLQDIVSILPFQPDPTEQYKWADVVVVPSKKPEPFGRVAIEAMAFGCAVIGTGPSGLTEIIVDGETGILVPLADADQMRKALSRLLEQEGLCAKLGLAGRLRFLRHFTDHAYESALTLAFAQFSGINFLEPAIEG